MKNLVVIIDSGVGGLSLLPQFIKKLPFNNYLYFADNINLPYGTKTKQELFEITKNNIKFIQKKYKPLIIVFGCNTIGSTIFKDLCNYFPLLHLFSIKPNINKQETKKTLVLATTSTIQSLKKQNYNSNIILQEMSLLAVKVENYLQDGINIVPYIKSKIKKYTGVNKVVLGCTHYYFVKNEILNILKNAYCVDGIDFLIKQILGFIKLNNIYNYTNKKQIKIKLKISGNKQNKDNKKHYKSIINKIKQG